MIKSNMESTKEFVKNMIKKILIHARRSIKFLLLCMLAIFLMVGIVAYLYKPTYSVTMQGKNIGYTENKSKLQARINDYIKNGDGEQVAFVQVENLPEYKLCLLKRGIVANDDEIYAKVKDEGTPYFRYYAILENQEEKLYVADFSSAEAIVNQLKEKNSSNIATITIQEKYETEVKEFTAQEEAVGKLYKEPEKVIQVAKTKNNGTSSSQYLAKGSVNTSYSVSKGKANLGISLIKPVSGILSSRFGERSSIRSSAHTGLDIAASTGTSIVAAASGTVTFSGKKGSYGNLLVISHGNGVQTYYGHCSKLYVSAGQTISQGQKIAAVGSTGNSTGPHLHLEIRVNGVAYNPQNYLY